MRPNIEEVVILFFQSLLISATITIVSWVSI
ncbi:hypothetical protein UFO1_2832 [Pelosinus sp. UFO1]|nr:hypothetical protein UFO1_2832 [Pelosinus sp. UFO1]